MRRGGYTVSVTHETLQDGASHETIRPRPRLRGVFHQYAFFVSLGACGTLLLAASSGAELLAAVIYAIGLCGVLGTSALYHRIDWSPGKRIWMRRLDHSMIFVLIAGTYTPFPLLVLDHPVATPTLIMVWMAALAGAALKLLWIRAPDWLSAAIYVGVGFLILPALPPLLETLGVLATALLALGGFIYTVGAIIYALKWPDPAPHVFGYHEIFHLCVVAAAALHFIVIAGWLVL